jgi:hypothetical protein
VNKQYGFEEGVDRLSLLFFNKKIKMTMWRKEVELRDIFQDYLTRYCTAYLDRGVYYLPYSKTQT